MIKVQSDTLNLIQSQLQNLKERECELMGLNDKQQIDMNLMRNRIKDLESELKNSEEKASNLQLAVST